MWGEGGRGGGGEGRIFGEKFRASLTRYDNNTTVTKGKKEKKGKWFVFKITQNFLLNHIVLWVSIVESINTAIITAIAT